MSVYHAPVLLDEVTSFLEAGPEKIFIDATLGGGSHTKALIDKGASVIGFDQDPDSALEVRSRGDVDHERLTIIESNFEHLKREMKVRQIFEVDGILFDLGVSSHQFDKPERGFSFQFDAPLDMRMSPSLMVTAKDLINGLGRRELYDLFTKYGDEQLARPISEAIIRARQVRPIETTKQLANLVERVYGRKHTHLHPATKVFQALRIAINDELNTLKITLPQATSLLKIGGKLAVISFHEGEDRIVKHFMRELDPELWEVLTKKPVTPGADELAKNPRCRSAKLRVCVRLKKHENTNH